MRPVRASTENQVYDLIVIGAGINGAGIARDAAMRGLKVLLLDKGDIAGGTSSWSTRLIHGGLRYLEHGELGLVRESLRERERLLHIAPHLVKPLPLLIPIYDGSRRGKLTIRAGMFAYDLLSFDKSLQRHRMLRREEAVARAPGLNAAGLRGAALYYDAQVEYAERLVLENVLSAKEHGAQVLTYARADKFLVEEESVRGVELTDLISESSHTARAPVVVNVSGPWVDEVLAQAYLRAQRLIGGTQGSHLVVEKFAGAPAFALYVEARQDGRPFFIIPWNDLYLVGTTDLPYAGDLDCVAASEAEIDYLLRETNRVIPQAMLERQSVLYTYSGVRPLPYLAEGEPAGVTRRHFVHDHAPDLEGCISIIGGKLTTYRNLSEQAVNLVFKKLRRESPPCATADEKLPGARDFAEFAELFKVEGQRPAFAAERLLRIYGRRARDVIELAMGDSELLKPVDDSSEMIGAELLNAFQNELAETLTDCLMRRTMVGLNSWAGLNVIEGAARVAQKYLGWDAARVALEVENYRKHLRRFHPRALAEAG